MSIPVGTRVGDYEIAEAIGAGGMGIVFRARDHALGRDVAIKILPPSIADDVERRQRFAREARLLAALSHPHIAQIYGIQDSSAGSAIVMELVPGATLRDLIRSGSITARDALNYARQIALALDAAHEKGIIHRDLKPDNVKVTADGVVKVLDFGLAKAWIGDGTSDTGDSVTLAGETRAGQVMGTVAYMSPEQARGQAVDRRTDIWAFGCVLFEMFSGRSPFGGPSASDIIVAVLEKDPDWHALPASTPLRVRRLIGRCLEKDRRQRLRDIGDALPELADDQASDLRREESASLSRSAPWRMLATVLGAIALALALATLWLWTRDRPAPAVEAPRPVRFALPPPAGARFGSHLPDVEAVTMAFSNDGARLAFVATARDTPPRIHVRALEDEHARVLAGTEGAVAVFWSPDGRSLGFFADGKLKRIDHAGGAAVTLCDVSLRIGMSGSWGAGGEILFASVQGDQIMRVSASGGTPVPVIRPDETRRRVLWPRYLPDGRRFLYTWIGERANGEIALVDADGTERPIVQALSQAQFVEPDLVLVVRESTLVAQRVDLGTGRPVGEPVSVIGPVAYSAATGWAEVTASPGGALALQTHRDVSRLAIVNRSGEVQETLSTPGAYLAVRPAPDGSALLFTRLRPELGTYDLWTRTFARGSETPVTYSPGMETGGVWFPKMQAIAMAAAHGGPPNLFMHDLATGRARQLVHSPRFQFPNDVSPDGKIVAYQQRTERGNWDLMQVHVDDGSSPQPIFASPASENDLRFAPQGGHVAFVSDESGRPEVYVAPFPPTAPKIQVSSGGGYGPRWRGDGRELYYASLTGDVMVAAWGADSRPADPVRLFRMGNWAYFDVIGNGDRFVAVVRESVGYEQPLTVLLNWRAVIGSR